MANELRPDYRPHIPFIKDKLFLAGSIENGKAEDWQQIVLKSFEDYKYLTIYNPRRAKWNPELAQSFLCETFNEQVVWEQDRMDECKYVLMNFLADTLSPISLLEFGQLSKEIGKTVVVVCPRGFWRRGNIEIVCIRKNIPLYETLQEGIAHLKTILVK